MSELGPASALLPRFTPSFLSEVLDPQPQISLPWSAATRSPCVPISFLQSVLVLDLHPRSTWVLSLHGNKAQPLESTDMAVL